MCSMIRNVEIKFKLEMINFEWKFDKTFQIMHHENGIKLYEKLLKSCQVGKREKRKTFKRQ